VLTYSPLPQKTLLVVLQYAVNGIIMTKQEVYQPSTANLGPRHVFKGKGHVPEVLLQVVPRTGQGLASPCCRSCIDTPVLHAPHNHTIEGPLHTLVMLLTCLMLQRPATSAGPYAHAPAAVSGCCSQQTGLSLYFMAGSSTRAH